MNAMNARGLHDAFARLCRRRFLAGSGVSLGAIALQQLSARERTRGDGVLAGGLHHAPRAKNVIYLHMEGAPPTLDMFDRKPLLDRLHGQKCPDSFLQKERFAFIKGHPRLLGHQHGWIRAANGSEVCELFPHLAQQLGDTTLVRSMVTDQFNHAPAEHLLFAGAPRPGRPSLGAWVGYGLGSDNRDLPAFVVMLSGGSLPSAGKALWSSGFLPSVHQGVEFRAAGDPVLYLQDVPGFDRARRERTLRATNDLNALAAAEHGDPETATRIAQFELAFRMQVSVPEAVDLASEPESVRALYGAVPGEASFANNCLLARRLVERGVRFVQLLCPDTGHDRWDQHNDLAAGLRDNCRMVDQPIAALLCDLQARGLLDDTIVWFGGEFGRTPFAQGSSGRDHNPFGFTQWLAGGGFRAGHAHGATDEFGYKAIAEPVTIHDLHATLLWQLGLDHERFTHRFGGRDLRLTDVHGRIVRGLLA